ncbi:hypothetical protein GCM10020219_041710 [Nonomuraea dietziae]
MLDGLRAVTWRSEVTVIGPVTGAGHLVCMMWVKESWAFSEEGMYIEYVSRQVSPFSHRR